MGLTYQCLYNPWDHVDLWPPHVVESKIYYCVYKSLPLALLWAMLFQFIPSHLIYACLVLPSSLFPWSYSTITVSFPLSPICATCPTIFILHELIMWKIFGESYKTWILGISQASKCSWPTTIWRRGNTQKNIYNIQITAKVWNQEQKMKLIIVRFCPVSCYFLLLTPRHIFQ